MTRILRKAFGIYPGEGTKAFQFARFSFFYAIGIATLETLSDGFFLEKSGAQFLPVVFLFTSLSMLLVSTLVLYSLRFTSPYRILTIALGMGAFFALASAFLIHSFPSTWFWYVFKISSKMLFIVVIACSWTFFDQYHDLQDAKRVYSLYNAAYFIGTICSGILINIALKSLGSIVLLIAAALFLIAALLAANAIAKNTSAVPDDSMDGIFVADKSKFASIALLIIRSPFTILLLSLSLVSQLLITVTEYSYMDSFGRAFQTMASSCNTEGYIAEFLGKCRSCISACNILFGFFFYSRTVKRIGISNAMLITPLFFLAVYSPWIIRDHLIIAVLGLIAVDGILFTIEDNCFNLLSNGVLTKLKSKVRIINDSFFEPIGMLFSSLLLFVMQSSSRYLGLILTLLTLAIALLLRNHYSKAILINLKDNALHFEKKFKDWFFSMNQREQKETQKEVLKGLRSQHEKVRLLACEALLSMRNSSTLPQILEVSRKFGTLSKIHLLKLFENGEFANDSRVLDAISNWMNESESPEFRKWAIFYLTKHGLHYLNAEEDLENNDLLLRGSSILTLLQKNVVSQSIDMAPINRAKAAKKIDLMLKSNRIDEISMALELLPKTNFPDSFEKTLPFLSHEAVIVKRSAAHCIAQLSNSSFSCHAIRLIDEIESARDNLFRLYCLDALGKMADSSTVKDLLIASVYFRPNERRKTEEIIISMRLKTVPILLSLTKDISIPVRSRILAGKILGHIALPQLQANLDELIDQEIERACYYFYFGHTIQKQYPLYDLELLQNALLTEFRLVLDFMIHLLGAAGSLEEPEMLARALHSRNEKIQSHALENLERTCNPRLFYKIAFLIDDRPISDKIDACLNNKKELSFLSLTDLLITLERSGSLYDKIVAVQLKSMLQMPNWRQELKEQIKHSDENFHQFAYELLER